MSKRDFEEGRYFELKSLIAEFEELFGKKPDGYEARVFHDVLRGDLFCAECKLLELEEQEQEAENCERLPQ